MPDTTSRDFDLIVPGGAQSVCVVFFKAPKRVLLTAKVESHWSEPALSLTDVRETEAQKTGSL